MKNIYFIIISLFILLLTGCGGSNNIKTDNKEHGIELGGLIKDKNKAYIVFMKEVTFSSSSTGIYEFDNKTFEPKYVASLDSGEKVVYELSEGTHYFFVENVRNTQNQMINKVNAKPGEVYYVDAIDITSNSSLNQNIDNYFSIVENQSCTDSNMRKFLLTKSDQSFTHPKDDTKTIEVYTTPFLPYSHKLISYSFIPYNFRGFYCESGSFKSFLSSDMKSLENIKKETSFIKPSSHSISLFNDQKQIIADRIKNFYSLWTKKLEGMPLSSVSAASNPVINIKKYLPDDLYNKFDGLNISNISEIHNNSENFVSLLKSNFNKGSKNQANLNITIINNDDGLQLARYLSPFNLEAASTRHVMIDFLDDKNNIISSVEFSGHLLGGLLGGSEAGFDEKLINSIKLYINKTILRGESAI